jgi:hypothetical protein
VRHAIGVVRATAGPVQSSEARRWFAPFGAALGMPSVRGTWIVAMTTWRCTGCGERNTHEFDACWSCGCAIDGERDPAFRVADDIDPRELVAADAGRTYLPYPPAKYQLSLRFLFAVVTISGFLTAIIRIPDGRQHMTGLLVFGVLWMLFGLLLVGCVYLASFAVGFFAFTISKRNERPPVDAPDSENTIRPPT